MKHFIQEWKFFSSEMHDAYSGRGTLCGLSPLFCDMVIKKAIAILAGPTQEAVKQTKLEQLCGQTPTGKFFYMYDIKEDFSAGIYEIELALRTDGLPVHYLLAVPKDDFDRFLTIMLSYIDTELAYKQA